MNESALPVRLTPALYAVSLLFLLNPVIDIVTNAWPLNVADVQWRFGSYGVASNFLISLLFGAVLTAAIAGWRGHRGVLFALSAYCALIAVILLGWSLLFMLDVLELRNSVRDDAQFLFRFGSAKAAFKVLTSALVCGFVGWVSFRCARDLGGRLRESAGLVGR